MTKLLELFCHMIKKIIEDEFYFVLVYKVEYL